MRYSKLNDYIEPLHQSTCARGGYISPGNRTTLELKPNYKLKGVKIDRGILMVPTVEINQNTCRIRTAYPKTTRDEIIESRHYGR